MTSYSHFTLEAIEAQFGIKNRMMPLFNSIKEIPVSDFLQRLLNNVAKLPMKSEKARSEMVVFPILLELRDLQNNFFTIYSGDTLNVDAERGLRGECDFIIAKDTGSLNVNAPIFQVVEAKKNDFDIGIPQCAAQMIASKIFNEKKGMDLNVIYGCVTTGEAWQFMKYIDNEILIDTRKYYLGDVGELLGVLNEIIDFYKSELAYT